MYGKLKEPIVELELECLRVEERKIGTKESTAIITLWYGVAKTFQLRKLLACNQFYRYSMATIALRSPLFHLNSMSNILLYICRSAQFIIVTMGT